MAIRTCSTKDRDASTRVASLALLPSFGGFGDGGTNKAPSSSGAAHSIRRSTAAENSCSCRLGTDVTRVARILSEKPHEWRAISIPHAKEVFPSHKASGVLFPTPSICLASSASLPLRSIAAAQPHKIRPALMPQPSDEGAAAAAAEQ